MRIWLATLLLAGCTAQAPLPETDAPTAARASAVVLPDVIYSVDEDGRLLAKRGGVEKIILESGAHGRPAVLSGGGVVVSRRGDAPGESDLWLFVGTEGRALAPFPGPDDHPTALPGGRVLFVSGRTTVASLFIADPESDAVEQLTNVGLVAGRPLTGFVPPPVGEVEIVGDEARYDAGGGERVAVRIPRATP